MSTQFGYHTDTLMYCKYLNKSVFDIHYIGFDLGYDRYFIPEIAVHYVPCHKNKIIRSFVYLYYLYKINRQINFDLVFHVHTKFSLIIRSIFLFRNYIFDIRTGDLDDKRWKKNLKNHTITILSKLTKNISVISEGLGEELNLDQKNRHIIPLGGEYVPVIQKDFSTIHLLYVGTLSKRNIHETVDGLALFLKTNKTIKIEYEIVGSGYKKDEITLKESIDKNSLNDIVHLHGYIKYSELSPFFIKCNVGVVYIPQVDYYQNQPSTKLYEYLLTGIPVIATNTNENRLELNITCGVICEDNPIGFSEALEKIYQNRMNYDSSQIQKQKRKSTWEIIVKENVEPYFKRIILDCT